jgi:hypothetical protein
MSPPDRGHLNHLSVNELDSVVFTQDSCRTDVVKLGYGELAAGNSDRSTHGITKQKRDPL